MKIVFVCLGNICRSPIAEGVMKDLVRQNGLNWHVESAGTQSYHIGKPPHQFSQEVCLENGIDISGQRAQLYEAEKYRDFDLVYAVSVDVLHEIGGLPDDIETPSRAQLLLEEIFPEEKQSVPDPWYGGKEGYYPVFKLLKRSCERIIRKYGKIA
jgi:protein-tyrosine phosphatase